MKMARSLRRKRPEFTGKLILIGRINILKQTVGDILICAAIDKTKFYQNISLFSTSKLPILCPGCQKKNKRQKVKKAQGRNKTELHLKFVMDVPEIHSSDQEARGPGNQLKKCRKNSQSQNESSQEKI